MNKIEVSGCIGCPFLQSYEGGDYLYNYECNYPAKYQIIGSADDWEDVPFDPDWCPLSKLIIEKV